MKKFLGLDLGTSSIGWAVVQENESNIEILDMGSRIIPLIADERDEFTSGNAVTKNQKRTQRRTQRKGYDRYQLRRKYLTQFLLNNNMFPGDDLLRVHKMNLWELRKKAASERVELNELGRILYHLNQKRGYKSARIDENKEKKDTDYVVEVKGRHQLINERKQTIGQYLYEQLSDNQLYRIRNQVFPREAYIEEFDAIMREQQKHYPELINASFINELKNEIIYFQRKLKSQKGLVSVCEFAGIWVAVGNGREIFTGPKVAPRSSPVFQACKIWENINSIKIKNRRNEELPIASEQKQLIFDFLNKNERLKSSDLQALLNLEKKGDWLFNQQLKNGIQGNTTRTKLKEILGEDHHLLSFTIRTKENNSDATLYDKDTGEVLSCIKGKTIDDIIEKEPLYQLWHTIYSINDITECSKALIKRFDLQEDTALKLAQVDFVSAGFGNKSVKAMRNILPYLMEGYVYSDACMLAGYNHSDSITKEENLRRKLIDKLPQLHKNSLRQPVVEKILNQMINVVNCVIEKYGRPDEIRVELARELKQSKEERKQTYKDLNDREKENDRIRKRLREEYGIRDTRNNVIKWRLFQEIAGDDTKINAQCVYCGKQFGITDALQGSQVDVEHIIPKALLFDDSQSNKTLSHRHCNLDKHNQTAYDYMASKGEDSLNAYIDRVNKLFKNKIIGRAKFNKLLMPKSKIPNDFIDRQIRETQYISKKSKEMLLQVCRNVWATSGTVTERLRYLWGWNDVLMNLQLPKQREFGLTEWVEWETNNGQKHRKEVIKDWTKRDDHRHHAIDALVVACTKQGFIQRMNNLSQEGARAEIYAEVENMNFDFREKLNLLDRYLIAQRPFDTAYVEKKASQILVSFKSGKKVATWGRRIAKLNGKKQIVQNRIVVPRGPLSEESVYGKIVSVERDPKTSCIIRHPVKYLFENPHLIFKNYIRQLVEERLARFDNDVKSALASLKKEPVFLDKDKKVALEYATCFKEAYVIKYSVKSLKLGDVNYIVDEKAKQAIRARLEQFSGKTTEAFKEPVYIDEENKIPILTVRCYTGLEMVEPVKKDSSGKDIGFVKPGNNHHIAIYLDSDGKPVEHLCTFWHAVERKKFLMPVVIKSPTEVWDKIMTSNNEYPEAFLERLPQQGWKFVMEMQQNKMFLMNMAAEAIDEAIRNNNITELSNHLYRVQKLTSKDYYFRHHTETQVGESSKFISSRKHIRIASIKALIAHEPRAVDLSSLGGIMKIGEKLVWQH